jgi:acyl-[acyl-carrier-protein]-phospholipid O-acyltransferase/long-chain-fatty-acid--[acyl-carrier-protein] ligase
MKKFLRWLLQIFFRYDAFQTEVLKSPGPVLLIPNHVSWFDWLLLGVLLDDDWKFVTSATTAQASWLHRKIMVNKRTFPIDTTSPYAVKRMAEYLQQNGRLVLFAEGRLSRTGNLMKLFDGTGFLLLKTRARVITCFIRGGNRLPFSPHQGWRQVFPKVSVHFSELLIPPLPETASSAEGRLLLTQWLRDQMVEQQFKVEMEFGPQSIAEAILETACKLPRWVVMQDATRQGLTYTRFITGADLLAAEFSKFIKEDEHRIGVLLPNVNATPVTLLALWFMGKVPAILNYSTGSTIMLQCLQLAGIRTVITSEKFLERARLDISSLQQNGIRFLFLEKIRTGITKGGKLTSLLRNSISPDLVNRAVVKPDEIAVILFTSGSEGVPKGVELSHTNLLANVRQILAIADLQDNDRVFNALPLFHSFGLAVGTLLPLIRGMFVFIYPSPLHYRVIPNAFYDLDCTVMLGTNTFLNGYARKAHAYDFRSLRYLFAGAEKLQEATARIWAEKFGVRILEGYGATECSPCVSLNTAMFPRFGTAGRLLPGIDYKIEPVEGVENGGRLLVRGPNIMKGYLNPEPNAKFQSLGGWYDTGDIAHIDREHYVQILGRLKRFAKISGEMVSLTAVEEALAGSFPQYGLRCQLAVVSRKDEEKGEALIAVTNEPKINLDEIRAALRGKGFSNLCMPREIRHVKEIPKLGTGKVNHRELEKSLNEA